MNDTLRDAVRREVGRQKLSKSQQEALAQLQQRTAAEQMAKPRSVHALRTAARASLAACALLLGFWLYLSPGDHPPQPQRIADEVALNHIKLKPLEVQSESMRELQDYFTELDFAPLENDMLRSARYQLLGGRYCSIEGQPAAQLRVLDRSSGEVHSLYQTHFDTELFGELVRDGLETTPLARSARGMEVDIWVEHGLLFALTRQPGSSGSGVIVPESPMRP